MLCFAGMLFVASFAAARKEVVARVRADFYGGSQRVYRVHKSPLEPWHPVYERWIRKAGSKQSAASVERKQWILALLSFALTHVLTHGWMLATALAVLGWCLPLLQLRGAVKKRHRDISRQMKTFLLFLRLYVERGDSPQQALEHTLVQVDGVFRDLLLDVLALMRAMTFAQAMSYLAEQVDHPELSTVAKLLRQSSQYGAPMVDKISQALQELSDNEHDRMESLKTNARQVVYFKFLLFFVSPIVLDVMLFLWGMLGGVFHQF